MDKKGIVGLDTGKAVLVALMILGVIGFAILITLQSLSDTSVAADTGSGGLFDETLTAVDEFGDNLSVSGLPSAACTVTTVVNATSGTLITAGNYTVTACLVAFTGPDSSANVNNTNWDVNYTYTFNRIQVINANISGGVEDFFGNAGTWFALLAIVIIILIVVIVMKAVTNIGGKGKGGGL